MLDQQHYDAVIVVSFGGPEKPNDVLPFLENVLRGKNVPQQRMLEVAEHYLSLGGISPINQQNRTLIQALKAEFDSHGIDLPIYWGNRNWHPLLPETLQQMADDGVRRAIAYFTSAFSSYSGCRQYRENIEAARQLVGGSAPQIDKLRVFYNHPGFIEAVADRTQAALEQLDPANRTQAKLLFTAHSIPLSMSDGSDYVAQLEEASRLVAQRLNHQHWTLVYQSRSGPPSQPWLEPDICDYIQNLENSPNLVVVPIGFVSDHMEVIYDLDTEAKQLCDSLGICMVRAETVGIHPRFISMIRELIQERTTGAPRLAIGNNPPNHDQCPSDCCLMATSSTRPMPASQLKQ